MSPGLGLSLLCLAATAALLWAEWRQALLARAICKLGASTAFVLLAWQLGAVTSPYGRWMLLALLLSWVGDALLLSARSRPFLLGLTAFLLAHLAFAAAFLQLPLNGMALALAGLLMCGLGLLVLRWLWPRLSLPYRWAVGAYVVTIAAMVVVALAASAGTGRWPLALGALVFAASDIAVARERFVAPGFINRLWGLPLYYGAQWLMATSVASDLVQLGV